MRAQFACLPWINTIIFLNKDINMLITDINELLTTAFQHKCYLEDDLTSCYKLKFPNISSIGEFNDIKDNIEIFLSQYDMKIGTMMILYPKEASQVFVLPINKLPLDQFLEKLNALLKDSQLHEAVNPNGVLQVKECLDNGANINNKNIFGDTALHIATRKDYVPIVSFLLEKGAAINIANHKDETPLGIADQNNDAIMGKAFIDTVLDPEAKKPELTRQVLIDYWDARKQKLADKSINQDRVAEALGVVPSPQRVKELAQFFFTKASPPMNEPQSEETFVFLK